MIHITIIGFGLIGSSLARALKACGKYSITACDRDETTRDYALQYAITDYATPDIQEACKQANIIVIAVPLAAYASIADEIAQVSPNAIITDIGSVKFEPAKTLQSKLADKKSMIVPAHPIAGSEHVGVKHGTADMFKGKKVIITTDDNVNTTARKTVEMMWEDAGATIQSLDAKTHDIIYAYVSHMVQWVMTCYDECALENKSTNKDFLRLTHSNPAMWQGTYEANKKALKEAVDAFCTAFDEIKDSTIPLSHHIAQAIKKAVPNEYKTYAGSGFASATNISAVDTRVNAGDTELFRKTIADKRALL